MNAPAGGVELAILLLFRRAAAGGAAEDDRDGVAGIGGDQAGLAYRLARRGNGKRGGPVGDRALAGGQPFRLAEILDGAGA